MVGRNGRRLDFHAGCNGESGLRGQLPDEARTCGLDPVKTPFSASFNIAAEGDPGL
jgi:hypothetical protein